MQQKSEALMQQARKFIGDLQEQIQSRLEDKQISARELEKKAGLKVSAVQNILSGRSTNPGIESLMAISKLLDCSVDELMGKSSSRSSALTNQKENNHEANIAWNYELYQNCVNAVERQLQSKNLNPKDMPNSKQVLFFIKEAYIYSSEGGSNTADLRFTKWIIDSHCYK